MGLKEIQTERADLASASMNELQKAYLMNELDYVENVIVSLKRFAALRNKLTEANYQNHWKAVKGMMLNAAADRRILVRNGEKVKNGYDSLNEYMTLLDEKYNDISFADYKRDIVKNIAEFCNIFEAARMPILNKERK